MTRLALVASSPCVNLQDIVSIVTAHGFAPDEVNILTNSATLAAESLGQGYDTVLSVAEPGHHNVQLLGILNGALKPGGLLIIKSKSNLQAERVEQLRKNLLLAGLVEEEVQEDGQGQAIRARKPQWETGAKAAISLKPRTLAAAPAAAAPSKVAWVVNTDDADEDEILNDDDLLTEEDLARPTPAANDDCEVGAAGRKACKNCTCGRAEAGPDAPPVKLTKDMIENPTSGCGSCALGDAFRCAGCPYRGLPSFEMGKPIQLPSDFLAVDV